MREIIFLQIGQCGIKVGEKFWELISEEHQINRCGHFCGNNNLAIQRTNVYFENGSTEKFVPRNVMVDLEPGTLNSVKSGEFGQLFSPDNFVCGNSGAGNSFARGRNTAGQELIETVMDKVRKEAEACDLIQGFQICHSVGGGSGSGLGALIMEKLNDQFKNKIINTFSVFPSEKISETVVEPYNAVFALSEMMKNSHLNVCFDNEALINICQNSLKINRPVMDDLNRLIALTIAGVTSCIRYPGQLNTDLRKLYYNTCPFPNQHFLVPSFAPLNHCFKNPYRETTIPELITELFDSKNQMVSFDHQNEKIISCASIFRGLVSTKQIEETMAQVQEKNPNSFVDWIGNHVQTAVCDIPPPGFQISGTTLINTSGITSMFKRLIEQFDTMFQKQAFTHWYTGEGMELLQFSQAQLHVQELIAEYRNGIPQVSPENSQSSFESTSSQTL